MTRSTRIGFIGGGNMAESLAGGLIASGWRAENIAIADPDPAQREFAGPVERAVASAVRRARELGGA